MPADRVAPLTLRVLMFCPQFRPLSGGTERQSELLAEALADLGVRVEVVTPRLDRAWPRKEIGRGGVCIHRYSLTDLSRRYPGLSNIGVLNTAIIGVQTARAVRALVSGVDVLHVLSASAPMSAFAARAGHRGACPVIARVASTGPAFDLAQLGRHAGWGAVARTWLRRFVDRWHAPSRGVADELRAVGIASSVIHHLPNGVRVPTEGRTLPELASRFLYLGRFARTAPRDVLGLIRAFESLADAVPGVELALVGGGEGLEEIRAVATASRASAQIRVPGHQDPDVWLAWAHCLVQPSFVEGMSNALLEAMVSGLACVAYDIAPNREALQEGTAGVLVPVGDTRALKAAMEDLASIPGLASSGGARGRRRAQQVYDIRVVARELVHLYSGLSDARRLGGAVHTTPAKGQALRSVSAGRGMC